MELTMKNGFCEMNEVDMLEVDGGVVFVPCIATALGVCIGGGLLIGGVTIDLMNCYSNGYNDVMYGN